MPRVVFTPHLGRWIDCPPCAVSAATVHGALEEAFRAYPGLRGYILDDQGRVRRHLTIYVDGVAVRDRDRLSDAVTEAQEIYVMQALSGG